MARARILNSYDVVMFANLLSNCNYHREDIETVLEAHGAYNSNGEWFGGFLVKKADGKLEYISYTHDRGSALDKGNHILDFPGLPENADKDPFPLNEWLHEEYE